MGHIFITYYSEPHSRALTGIGFTAPSLPHVLELTGCRQQGVSVVPSPHRPFIVESPAKRPLEMHFFCRSARC